MTYGSTGSPQDDMGPKVEIVDRAGRKGGRPPGFDPERYKQRNVVERPQQAQEPPRRREQV